MKFLVSSNTNGRNFWKDISYKIKEPSVGHFIAQTYKDEVLAVGNSRTRMYVSLDMTLMYRNIVLSDGHVITKM